MIWNTKGCRGLPLITSDNTPIPDMYRLGVMYTSGIAGTLTDILTSLLEDILWH
jgi:hypothetical protein